jgi:hypothetical protein
MICELSYTNIASHIFVVVIVVIVVFHSVMQGIFSIILGQYMSRWIIVFTVTVITNDVDVFSQSHFIFLWILYYLVNIISMGLHSGPLLLLATSVVWWLACWPLVPKIEGSIPAEAIRFSGRKNPQHASVPWRRFAACKRTLWFMWNRTNWPAISRP